MQRLNGSFRIMYMRTNIKHTANFMWIAGILCFSILACKQTDIDFQDYKLDEVITLPFVQTARIPSEKIEITFAKVVSESRCPKEAFCTWPGEVTVALNLKIKQRDRGQFELSLWPGKKEKTTFERDGYQFELLEVNPYPENALPPESDYEIEIIVTKQ